jgi:C-terminal processing protease CtpA/Prc
MKKLLYFLFAIFLLAACAQEEQFDNTPEGNFNALWKIVDEHYCFLDYKRQAIGLDWNEVRSRYRARLSDDMTSAQLFEVLTEMLSELRDGHVNLYTPADVGRNWSWYEDFPPNFYQDLQDAYLGTDYKIASGISYRILDDNIAYVVCPSFTTAIGEGNLDAVFLALQSCSGLILDVRNNSGGNLTTAEALAQRFTNERLHVGYISHKTGPGHGDFSEPVKQYLEPSDGVRWQKTTVVLTNRRCYSATNNFVRDMKCCPNVTVMGDQTGGGSGMPFSSELPNGWSVRFSACPMYDREMRHIEFGIQPDITVALTPEDRTKGLDTLIESARTLLSGK